jgi:hypothetical protein
MALYTFQPSRIDGSVPLLGRVFVPWYRYLIITCQLLLRVGEKHDEEERINHRDSGALFKYET